MPVMPTYPGVYIEEIPSGVRTITGVATSITAFLGRASRGRMNKAVRILSLSDFNREFGDPNPKSELADSVRLFFANGGTDAYVIRLANGAEKAQVALHSLEKTRVLVAKAKAEGVWANTVRLEVDYNTSNPDETFNLTLVHEADGRVVNTETFRDLSMNPGSPRFAPAFVTQGSALVDMELDEAIGPGDNPDAAINSMAQSFTGFSQARRPLGAADNAKTVIAELLKAGQTRFDVRVNDDGPFVTVDLAGINTSAAATMETIATAIKDRINFMLPSGSQVMCNFLDQDSVLNLLTISSAKGDQSSVRVRRATSNDVAAALMLGVDQGGIEPVRWSNFRPAPTATFSTLGEISGTEAEMTGTINQLAGLNQDAVDVINIDGILVELRSDFTLVTTSGDSKWFESARVSGNAQEGHDGVREKLRIIARAINATANLNYEAEVWGYHLALKASRGTTNARPMEVSTSPNKVLGMILTSATNIRQYSLGTTSTGEFVSGGVPGDDGKVPEASDYIGDPGAQTGLYALDQVDLFNLLVIPGDEEVNQTVLDQVWGPASIYCQQRRAFLLVEAPRSWTDRNTRPTVVQDRTLIDQLRNLVVNDHSAVFYPRLRYASNGLSKTIGPTGALAGLFSRTDATRGVWKAPAGLEADLRGILGLELNLTDGENGVLNQLGVNALRSFPSGLVSWGARTLDGADQASEWKYIPVRRLALFLEESLYRGTQWVVFEPNDEALWAQIRLNIGAFMQNLFLQGAFQGKTPREAYLVKVDRETTTQDDINRGIVNILVGFAPLRPAEFVIIRIQQLAGQLAA